MTLLEKAEAARIKNTISKPVTAEELELVLAWYNSRINYSQVLAALFPGLGRKQQTGRAYTILCTVLRNAIFQGHIKIVENK